MSLDKQVRSLGIDVHGHAKGLHVAKVAWGATLAGPHVVSFCHVPLTAAPHGACPYVSADTLRALVAESNIKGLAEATYAAAAHVGKLLLEMPGDNLPGNVAIDSPSGFARNCARHGRLTEKLRGVYGFRNGYSIYPQMTPSLDCRKPHRGHWAWILVGMAAFAAFSGQLKNLAAWRAYIGDGPDGSEPVETFPSATIQFLRQPRNAAVRDKVLRLLDGMVPAAGHPPELVRQACSWVRFALENGPTCLSKNDHAAALVAALSTLPAIYTAHFCAIPMSAKDGEHKAKHKASGRGCEGAITLVG